MVYLTMVNGQTATGHSHKFFCSFPGGAVFDNYDYAPDGDIENAIQELRDAVLMYLEDRRKKEMSSSEQKLVEKLEHILGWDD